MYIIISGLITWVEGLNLCPTTKQSKGLQVINHL